MIAISKEVLAQHSAFLGKTGSGKTSTAKLAVEQVAAAAGYEPGGGGFNNALSRLRTLELIEGRGELRASDDLFQEAA